MQLKLHRVLEANIALMCACATFLPAFWKSVFSRSQRSTVQASIEAAQDYHREDYISNGVLVGGHKFDSLTELEPIKTPRSNQSDFTQAV